MGALKFPNPTREHLRASGFYCSSYSEEGEIYTYKFPVLKYNKTVVLEARFTTEVGNGVIRIDVYDVNNKIPYSPYYVRPDSHRNILEGVDKRILKELSKLKVR